MRPCCHSQQNDKVLWLADPFVAARVTAQHRGRNGGGGDDVMYKNITMRVYLRLSERPKQMF